MIELTSNGVTIDKFRVDFCSGYPGCVGCLHIAHSYSDLAE